MHLSLRSRHILNFSLKKKKKKRNGNKNKKKKNRKIKLLKISINFTRQNREFYFTLTHAQIQTNKRNIFPTKIGKKFS